MAQTKFRKEQLDEEVVQDIVGAMFSSNTETGIVSTYDDTDGKIDLDVFTATNEVYLQRTTSFTGVSVTTTDRTITPVAGFVAAYEVDLSGMTADRTLILSATDGTGPDIGTQIIIVISASAPSGYVLSIAPDTGKSLTLHKVTTAWDRTLTTKKQALFCVLVTETDWEIVAEYGTTIPDTGWIPKTETWTRTANHTFTISGDYTNFYRKGTKVRYKDGGSYEYGVIASSAFAASTTTVILITNTSYTMAAVTITDKYISYVADPEGFPTSFNYQPSYFGSTVAGTPTVTTTLAKWTPIGGSSILIGVDWQVTNLGGATGTLIFTSPVSNTISTVGVGRENAATGSMCQLLLGVGSNVVIFTYNNGAFLTTNYQLIGSVIATL